MMRKKRGRECESEGARGRWIVGTMFAVGLFAGGCDARHVLGDVGGTGGAGGDAGPLFPGMPMDAGYPGDVSGLGPLQSWTGYLEGKTFPSGSDAIHLSFATDPTGLVVGTMTLGSGTPPPPATDPNASYPPGVIDGEWAAIFEGIPFTIANGTLVGSRLRVEIWTSEMMKSWCALQTPVPGSAGCLPNWDFSGDVNGTQCAQTSPTGQVVPVSCAKIQLCIIHVACICTMAGCTPSVASPIGLDVSLSDTTADGTLLGFGNLRLTKDP